MPARRDIAGREIEADGYVTLWPVVAGAAVKDGLTVAPVGGGGTASGTWLERMAAAGKSKRGVC